MVVSFPLLLDVGRPCSSFLHIFLRLICESRRGGKSNLYCEGFAPAGEKPASFGPIVEGFVRWTFKLLEQDKCTLPGQEVAPFELGCTTEVIGQGFGCDGGYGRDVSRIGGGEGAEIGVPGGPHKGELYPYGLSQSVSSTIFMPRASACVRLLPGLSPTTRQVVCCVTELPTFAPRRSALVLASARLIVLSFPVKTMTSPSSGPLCCT